MEGGRRPYVMTARAASAEATAGRILESMYERLLRLHYDEVTLADVAADAGVTVQTVLRRFGSKEGLLRATLDAASEAIGPWRDASGATTLAEIVDVVVTQYERDGDAVVRMIALADRLPIVEEPVERGRRNHRSWVAEALGDRLPPSGEEREVALTAAVVATDVFTWRICRRDRRLTRSRTRAVMGRLLEAAVAEHTRHPTTT